MYRKAKLYMFHWELSLKDGLHLKLEKIWALAWFVKNPNKIVNILKVYNWFSVQFHSSLRLFSQMKRLRPLARQYFIWHLRFVYNVTKEHSFENIFFNLCKYLLLQKKVMKREGCVSVSSLSRFIWGKILVPMNFELCTR